MKHLIKLILIIYFFNSTYIEHVGSRAGKSRPRVSSSTETKSASLPSTDSGELGVRPRGHIQIVPLDTHARNEAPIVHFVRYRNKNLEHLYLQKNFSAGIRIKEKDWAKRHTSLAMGNQRRSVSRSMLCSFLVMIMQISLLTRKPFSVVTGDLGR